MTGEALIPIGLIEEVVDEVNRVDYNDLNWIECIFSTYFFLSLIGCFLYVIPHIVVLLNYFTLSLILVSLVIANIIISWVSY